MPHGYHGKILHVDLTAGTTEVEEPSEVFYRRYMGGSALGAHYLLKNTPANVDALDPQNTLVLSLSVITGTPISGQSRLTTTAKSPLTDGIGDAQSGGFFPAEMKFAGFDAIVIKGKADKPVYLWINEGEVEIRDAAHLWGKITGDAEAMIREELGDDKIEVLQIGPAGENRVRFASTISMSNRANGRTGMGAVMGSKNLKAVAVRGKKRPTVADKKGLNNLARWGSANLDESDVAGLAKYGTAEVMMPQHKSGGLPTYNWDSGVFENAEPISGEVMYDTILKERDTCYACTVRCKRVVEVSEGPYQSDPHYGGPEYETLATFGSYCGIDNLEAIATANQLCNMYGMDTISCGATIAWAFNCYEEGLLTAEDTGGLELNWGNAEAMVTLTEQIGKREGFGDVLAEGSARAADQLERGHDLLVTFRKQEAPAHMPQVKKSLGLIYAVNPFGADHQSSEHDPVYEGGFEYYQERLGMIGLTEQQERYSLTDEKIRFAMVTQYFYSMLDSVNMCQFVMGPSWHLYGPDQLLDAVQKITGWDDLTMDELLEVGERRLNMLRAFNAREGFTREDDAVPAKLFKPLEGGRSDGFHLDKDEMEQAKTTYYELCGWDVDTGNPTPEKLESLGLKWIAEML